MIHEQNILQNKKNTHSLFILGHLNLILARNNIRALFFGNVSRTISNSKR